MIESFGTSECCKAPIYEPCDDGFGRCSNCQDMATVFIECQTCGAQIVNGVPQYDPKTSQRAKCIDYDIKKIMVKIREKKKNRR